MNVSISSVVEDLDATVSGVQSTIALEALVSAAFILIGSKIGDLIGRKRAYVLGLLGYAAGALSMAFAQNVIDDPALLGDPRRTRRLVAAAVDAVADPRQLRGRRRRSRSTRLVGAAAAIAAAVGPLIGGFITTYLSWRVAFLGEAVVIAIVLSGIGLVRDVPVHRDAHDRSSWARSCRRSAWAGSCSASSCGRRAVRRSASSSRSVPWRWPALAWWLVRRKRAGKSPLIDPDLFAAKPFRIGISQQMMQQIALGGTMIALPIFLQMVLEYNAMEAGLSIAPLSLSMFAVALIAGRKANRYRPAHVDHGRLRLVADRSARSSNRSCPAPTPAGIS